MHDELKQALHKIGTLNEVVNKIFEIIPNLIEDKDFLDNMNKCFDILQKINEIKKIL